ncbi:MAG: hypothetical protein FVQ81_09205 [Candidatus Glassbacteria bacterium]|nr:hypothetical protein [Candidatus Glassbacteria bacterium]
MRFYQLNMNKGSQSNSGVDDRVPGDVTNGADNCSGGLWMYKTLTLDNFYVRASNESEICLLLGTDSGYEGITTLYFSEISVVLTPIDPDIIIPGT